MMADKKVIIITGGNSGIGKATAIALCRDGHEVIMSVRDDHKGRATVDYIKGAVWSAKVSYIVMDLEYPDSIRRFVDEFMSLNKPLHILINNAALCRDYRGGMRTSARDDWSLEVTMTVNCMGPFLLTNLLLDKLKETGTKRNPARVVNVSSVNTVECSWWNSRWWGSTFDIDDLMLENHYISGAQAIRNSKLALNLWSKVLAQKFQDEKAPVIVNTVCPGLIPSTGLVRETEKSWRGWIAVNFLDSFAGRFFYNTQEVEVGRKRLVQMAIYDHTKTNGEFYYNGKRGVESDEVNNETHLARIWDLCVKYSGL